MVQDQGIEPQSIAYQASALPIKLILDGVGARNRTLVFRFGDECNTTIRHPQKWCGLMDSNHRALKIRFTAGRLQPLSQART